MLASTSLILLHSFSSFASQAISTPVIFGDHFCVQGDVAALSQKLLQFDQYSKIPATQYSVKLLNAEIPLLRMVKSQYKKIENGFQTNYLVWLVLQPTNLEDASQYPRFLLSCNPQSFGSSFQMNCQLQKDKQHYGLEDLNISIQMMQGLASAKTGECSEHEVSMQVQISIQSNASEVLNIKQAVLKPAGPLGSLLEPLFNEQEFFKNYFLNLYRSFF